MAAGGRFDFFLDSVHAFEGYGAQHYSESPTAYTHFLNPSLVKTHRVNCLCSLNVVCFQRITELMMNLTTSLLTEMSLEPRTVSIILTAGSFGIGLMICVILCPSRQPRVTSSYVVTAKSY